MITDINSEDRAVQRTFAEFLKNELGWDSAYAWNQETFGVDSLLGRESMREVVLSRDLRTAINRLNHDLPASAVEDVVRKPTGYDVSRSMTRHNSEFYDGFVTVCRCSTTSITQGFNCRNLCSIRSRQSLGNHFP